MHSCTIKNPRKARIGFHPVPKGCPGFTLIELLVVIAIIAILAAILFPVFAQAREKARSIVCLSNIKQIGMGTMMYVQDYDEKFPQAWGGQAWVQALDPYQKAGVAADGSNWNQNKGLIHCPNDSAPASTSYAVNALLAGIGGVWGTQIGFQQSQSLAAINAPAEVVWGFETTHRWFGGVVGDPPTDSPRCMMPGDGPDPGWVYDIAAPCGDDSTVVLFRKWLKDNDFTDFTGDFWPYGSAGNTCPNGAAVCSKYPAFRHSRAGDRTGFSNMVFSDGHAKSVRWGTQTPANWYPNLSDAQKAL